MIRSLNGESSNERSPVNSTEKQSFKDKPSFGLGGTQQFENQNKYGFRIKKENGYSDGTPSNNMIKNSIQDIITPVVQISYNQIKNAKSKGDAFSAMSQRAFSSKQQTKIDLMKTVSSLNRALTRKSKSGIRSESGNKSSFLSLNPSTSFQHHINLDDDNEGELDERIGAVPLSSSVNVSRIESNFPSKRSVSEMSKSIAHAISVSKAPKVIANKSKEKYLVKNQTISGLNEIKTVSLHEHSGSTKSGGQGSAIPVLRSDINGALPNNIGKFRHFS